MKLIDTRISTPVQSWLSRVEKRQPAQADYFSELRSWVRYAILEAEEKKDLNKKGRFLNLLKDLEECPENGFKMEEITVERE